MEEWNKNSVKSNSIYVEITDKVDTFAVRAINEHEI